MLDNGETREYLLVCSCNGQWKKAAEAFNRLFPNKVLPDIVKGRDRIYKLSQQLDNEHIKAISKLTGKYSYFVKTRGRGIIEEIDLITGQRVA